MIYLKAFVFYVASGKFTLCESLANVGTVKAHTSAVSYNLFEFVMFYGILCF